MRPDAMLHVINISDEPEQSEYISGETWNELVDQIVAEKGSLALTKVSAIAGERADAVEAFLAGDHTRLPTREYNKPAQTGTSSDGLSSNFTSDEFRESVAEIVRSICEGDSWITATRRRPWPRSQAASTIGSSAIPPFGRLKA